nr:hypothetical protein [Tanacetum cinerariifolium]
DGLSKSDSSLSEDSCLEFEMELSAHKSSTTSTSPSESSFSTPGGGRDFYSEEIENFLNEDSIPIGIEKSVFDQEEDILFLEGLLSGDPSPPPSMNPNQTKPSIKEPEHLFSIGYEHFSTTLVTNEVAESSTKNLVPIP